jgi:uncharacterized protein YndB with AHSA1/START domain
MAQGVTGMVNNPGPPSPVEATRQKITIEHTFRATLEEVWDLWTTKEGPESWWGPEGFVTTFTNPISGRAAGSSTR